MLPQIGGLEWLVIATLALVVIGPKDLPGLLRTLGQWTAKLRSMANEFRTSFDDMARQSELEDLRKEVEAMRSASAMPDAQAALDAFSAPLVEPYVETPIVEGDPEPPKPVRKPRARKSQAAEQADVAPAVKPRRKKAQA